MAPKETTRLGLKLNPITANSAPNGECAQVRAKWGEPHSGPNVNNHPFGSVLPPSPMLALEGTNTRSTANGERANQSAEGAKAHSGPNANQNTFGTEQGARPRQGEGGRSSFGPGFDPPFVRQRMETVPKQDGWVPMPYWERIGPKTRSAPNETDAIRWGLKPWRDHTNSGSQFGAERELKARKSKGLWLIEIHSLIIIKGLKGQNLDTGTCRL